MQCIKFHMESASDLLSWKGKNACSYIAKKEILRNEYISPKKPLTSKLTKAVCQRTRDKPVDKLT